jgi:3-hydroxyacyl-[acyl-carrier-protein] dehydratase
MLLQNFYTLNDLSLTDENLALAKISLNSTHEIFKGHFPGNPITPGVCMMQIIKEICSKIVQSPIQMTQSKNIKFLAIINPEVNPKLDIKLNFNHLDADNFTVSANVSFAETNALKVQAQYVKLAQ